ncbi:MAG TPA: EamA family transporter [Conexibacter sp.]|nr:EamA family transporter [Conexibacter sp.]
MLAIALSLCCSLSWGASDFLGGYLGRRVALLRVLACSQGTSLALGLALAFALGGAPALDGALALALGAGACSIAGVAALYRALSIGTMGVVAPIAATSALLPVLVGLASGDRPGALQAAGMALALAGVITTSRESRREPVRGADRPAVAYALLAALGFGLVQVLLGAGARHGVVWTIGAMRVGAVATLGLFAVALRGHAPAPPAGAERRRTPVALLLATGALDLAAATFYATATTHGLRSVVAVLGSLYPVVTVLLARVLLTERLVRHQRVGALATLAGVILVAAG